MRKVLVAVILMLVAVLLWRASAPPPEPPVTDSLAPIADSGDVDPNDRVAVARVQHGAEIAEKFHAVGVAYPGEIFLRWLKHEALLELWARNPKGRFRLVHAYPILAASGGAGPKRREGDRQVPEGFYEIDRFNPKSTYHLSLGLNYPNASDRVLSDRDQPGSDIFIHGSDVSIGCAPLGDDAIEEVYFAALDARAQGQQRIEVHVFPGRMTGADWEAYATAEIARRPELAAFWAQLRPGFEYFEQHRQLPVVSVTPEGRYEIGR
jgi:murein L,D-transpeptidase YafK